MRIQIETCDGCKWYHDWFGVCTNGDSEERGGTPNHQCEFYEAVKDVQINIPLPETCVKCPMFEYGVLSNCKLLKKPLLWYESKFGRDKECPLVEAETYVIDKELLESSGFEW